METCTNVSMAALLAPKEEGDCGLETGWGWIIALTTQTSSKKSLKLTFMWHYRALTNLLTGARKK